MSWTREQKLKALMRLPWSVRTEWNADEGYLVARVKELPSVLATGVTDRDLARDLWESLESSLSCYLEFDDPISLPAGAVLPWESSGQPRRARVEITLRGAAWETAASTAAGKLIKA